MAMLQLRLGPQTVQLFALAPHLGKQILEAHRVLNEPSCFVTQNVEGVVGGGVLQPLLHGDPMGAHAASFWVRVVSPSVPPRGEEGVRLVDSPPRPDLVGPGTRLRAR